MAPLYTRPFFLLCAGHFMAALGIIASVLLPIRLDWLGASRTEIGFTLSLMALGGLVSRPLVGWALDAWGRKPVICLGIAFCVVGIVALGFIDALGVSLYLTQLFWGVGVGAFFTGIFTFASDHIPEEHRTRGMAFFGVFGLLPLGLYGVIETLHVRADELHVVFWAIGSLIGTSFFFVVPIPELHVRAARSASTVGASSGRLGEFFRALFSREMTSVWIADVVFATMFAVFLAFVAVTASAQGMASPGNIWLVYALFALGVRTVGGSLMQRVGPDRIVLPALLLYVVAIVLCGVGRSPGVFLVAGAFAGAGHGYAFPVLASLVVSRAEESVRGAAFAFYTGLWDFSLFASRPVGGWAADRWGDQAMYGCVAAFVSVGLVLFVFAERRRAR